MSDIITGHHMTHDDNIVTCHHTTHNITWRQHYTWYDMTTCWTLSHVTTWHIMTTSWQHCHMSPH